MPYEIRDVSLPPCSDKVLSLLGSLRPGATAQQHQWQASAFSSIPQHRHTTQPHVDLPPPASPAMHRPSQPCCPQQRYSSARTSSRQKHPLKDQFERGTKDAMLLKWKMKAERGFGWEGGSLPDLNS